MWAAYGNNMGYVWAGSEESAFEIWVEWLDDNEPGCLTSHEEFVQLLAWAIEELAPEYVRREVEATSQAGQTWHAMDYQATVDAFHAEHAICGCINSRLAERVLEHAEADLTSIGHTSLKHGSHIASYERGLDSIDPGTQEYREAFSESVREALTCDLVDIADALSCCEPPCEVTLAYPRKGGDWEANDVLFARTLHIARKAIPACSGCEDTGCSENAACEAWEAIAQELIADLCEAILQD